MTTDVREGLGFKIDEIKGPFTIREAERIGDGSDGGSLDTALIASTADGTRVVIGEIWAACPNDQGGKTRINAKDVAAKIARVLDGSGETFGVGDGS